MKFNAGWRILVPARDQIEITSGGSDSGVVQSSTSVVTEAPVAQSNSDSGSFDYEDALEIIRLTNEERAKVGVPPLTVDEALMELARKRATEIAANWGHEGLFDDCSDCGENIASAIGAARIMELWLTSEGHANNLLAPEWSHVGVGYYIVGNRKFASQLFK